VNTSRVNTKIGNYLEYFMWIGSTWKSNR